MTFTWFHFGTRLRSTTPDEDRKKHWQEDKAVHCTDYDHKEDGLEEGDDHVGLHWRQCQYPWNIMLCDKFISI